jgi:hypothetical protein
MPQLKTLFFALILTFLSSCKVNFKNDWTLLSPAPVTTEHFESLKRILADKSHNIYSLGTLSKINPHEDFAYITKSTAEGKWLWSIPLQCTNGPSEMLASDIINEQLIVAMNQCLVALNLDGKVIWETAFDQILEINDLKILQNTIYVLGKRFEAFSLDGNLLFSEELEEHLWSIQEHDQLIYIAGSGKIKMYTRGEDSLRTLIHFPNYAPPAQLLFGENKTIYAVFFNAQSDHVTLIALTLSGRLLWKKSFKNADFDSPNLPAAPLLDQMSNQLVLSLSKYGHREILLINKSNGHLIKKEKNKHGIIRQSLVLENKVLAVFGERTLDFLDENLELFASYNIPYDALVTSGDFLVENNALYLGASILREGSFRFYLARFSLKQ